MVFSLIVAFVVTPWAAIRLLGRPEGTEKTERTEAAEPAENENRLPGVFESVAPTARYAVVRFAPAQLVYEPPTPPADVGDG